MSKVRQSILAGARQALAFAQGEREGFVEHRPAPRPSAPSQSRNENDTAGPGGKA
ncbi:hypothetical protein L2U69_09030 [Zavarzinia compransoris]|uniref:hypothetical protein n=1 Tax=Zavarzinia marina TaxID=2911065 RepID=UPI001F235C40|nr:hypothetical protein [Zavarzinia marina]MCF4165784.1 hypothetical protein [Zavarzinia marina]